MTGWTETRLDRVATVNARIGWKALTAAEYQEEGFVFLSTPNIKQPEIDFENVNYITQFRFDESPELKLRVGDVLLAKDGNTLGITNVVAELPHPATVNGSIAVLRPFAMDGRFLRYQLDSAPIQGRIQAFKDGMGVPHLFQRDINRFPLVAPPLAEQRAIADYLDAETARIDAVIAKKQQLIHLLEERRLAAIDDAVGSAGAPSVAVRRLSSRITSGPRGWAGYASDTGTPFIRITNIQRNRIDLDMTDTLLVDAPESAESDRTRVQVGDVLVSITADIGSVGCVPAELAGSNISQHVALVRPANCEPEWLAYAIRSTPARAQLDSGQYGGTKTQLSLDDIASLRVPYPVRADQRRALAVLQRSLEAIDSADSRLRSQISLLAEHRQALITAAVAGGVPAAPCAP